MVLFLDNEGRILDVETTNDASLTRVEVSDDGDNPFVGWNTEKICCYRVTVTDGHITMMTPYVPSNLIEKLSQLQSRIKSNDNSISEIEDALIEISNVIYPNEEEEV